MQAALPVALIAGTAVVTAVITRITCGLAMAAGIVSLPNPLVAQHKRPVAYLGGVAIFAGCAVAAIVAAQYVIPIPLRLAIPAALFLMLGVIDDLMVLRPSVKFAGQVIAATVAVGMGVLWHATGLALVDRALCLMWILIVVNAFNLTDVCDGLVAGLSCVTFACLGLLQMADLGLMAILIGACAGFLTWNRPPARIFLGDAGSHLLGFLAAALPLLAPPSAIWPRAAQMVLLVGVPIFELVFLVHVRIRKGLPWWKGSPDHLALRLQAAGLSRWQTDLAVWFAAAALGAVAIGLSFCGAARQVLMLAITAILLAACWRALLQWEVVRPQPLRHPHLATLRRAAGDSGA